MDGEHKDGDALTGSPPAARVVPKAFRVRHVLDSLVLAFTGGTPPSAEGAPVFDLRIIDDDGEIDEDFPVLDTGVHIASVGVSRFAVVPQGGEEIALYVQLPEELDLDMLRSGELGSLELECCKLSLR